MAYDPFEFFFPTRILFGAGESARTAEYLERFLAPRRVFVVTYGDFTLPALPGILRALEAAGMETALYAHAVPNPRAADVDAGAQAYRSSGADCILGVGGGSVIDTAKAIALLAANPSAGGVWDYVGGGAQPARPAAPVALVVSIASTGSEGNESFVLTGPDGRQKLIYSHESLRPRFSVCDPELSYTLPPRQTALGAADIFSHILEQYLHGQPGVEASDEMSLGLMRAVVQYAPRALAVPDDAAARANLMWASILAMSRVLGVGHAENWVCHMLEHAVSARFDLPHAAGMTAIFPAYLAFIAPQDAAGKLAKLSARVFGAAQSEQAGAGAVRAFFRSLGLPVSLTEALGRRPGAAEIGELAQNAIPWGAMEAGGYRPFTVQDAEAVLLMALEEH